MSKILGLIPARGNSSRVPDKNMRILGGRPLVAWTFAAAQCSRMLDRSVLTTDSQRIIGVAAEYGISTPFTRPAQLATDTSRVIDTAIHALKYLADEEGYIPDYVMLLQPTSPFRTAQDIDAACEMARKHPNHDAVLSVQPAATHPYLMRDVDSEGGLRKLSGHKSWDQEMKPLYQMNGAIYLVKLNSLLQERDWRPDSAVGYVMPEDRSVDVDTEWDMKMASLIVENRLERYGAESMAMRNSLVA